MERDRPWRGRSEMCHFNSFESSTDGLGHSTPEIETENEKDIDGCATRAYRAMRGRGGSARSLRRLCTLGG